MWRKTGSSLRWRSGSLLLMLAAWVAGAVHAAPPIQVSASLSSRQVLLGGEDRLQIDVEGSDHPTKPALASMPGFQLAYDGGSANDSTSITIVNGNETTTVRKGYVFSYTLTPTKLGRLAIPSIPVSVGGTTYHTRPLHLTVGRPQKTSAFLLRLALSRTSVYVGEPVILTVDWYLSRNVTSVRFDLPILANSAFRTRPVSTRASSSDRVTLPLGGGSVAAIRSSATRNGRSYTLISFRRLLVPTRAGSYRFDNSAVDLATQAGSSSLFGSFFGGASASRDWVIPGSPLRIDVRSLPLAGRPANFSGLVGRYALTASATPTAVNVGDPIALTIRLSGGPGVAEARLPRLRTMKGFSEGFQLPSGRPAGTLSGNTKSFTRTIRALNERVAAIPAVEVPYFDPQTGRYAELRAPPIRIDVRPTHILTAKDLQGAPVAATAGRSRTPSPAAGGIDYNYEGYGILSREHYSPIKALLEPRWIAAGAAPFIAFIALLGFIVARRRIGGRSDGRDAAREFFRICDTPGRAQEKAAAVYTAFCRYLRLRLGLTVKSPSYEDIHGKLPRPEFEEQVRGLVALHEELHYAGFDAGEEGAHRLVEGCRVVVAALERGGAR